MLRFHVLFAVIAAFLFSGCFADPASSEGSTSDATDSMDASGSSTTEASSGAGDMGTVDLDLPADDPNWGLLFDGNDAGTSPNTDVSLGAAFTVEMWVRFDFEERYGVLLDTRAVEVTDQGWTFYIDPPAGAYAGHLVFYYNGADGMGYYLVGPVLEGLDDWHHFAAVRQDSGELTIYVDGVVQASDNFVQPPGRGAAKLFIGRQYADDAAADTWWRGGVLDDVHVSSTARYVTDFVPEQALLDGDSRYLWRFNEGSGDTTWDEVNNIPLALDAPEWVFVN